MPVKVGEPFRAQRLATPLDRLMRRSSGKRSFTRTSRKRGRYVSSRPPKGRLTDLAFDATIREAAPHQVRRPRRNLAINVDSADLREKIRVRRAANLILFVVDASWSMAAAERMVATKGAVFSLLMDAYQKRDQVSMITFQKESARLVLPPTSSVDLAQKLLCDLPVGGKTPLSRGLYMAYEVMMQARRKNPEVMPLMILLTDGAGNVSISDNPPQEEALYIASMIKNSGVRSVVINTEHEALDRGLAQGLADKLGAPCYSLGDIRAEALYETVRDELKAK